MGRIQTNLPSLTGQHNLSRAQDTLNISLVRLSTGLRINNGKDDPSGLIASEVLRSEIGAIGQSIRNSERANNIVATADAALSQVSTLLNDIRSLIEASANKGAISSAEIAANQVQIDSALDSVTRIAQTTVFGGDKLLNGAKSFAVSASGGALGPFQSTADITINSFDPTLHTASVGDDVSVSVTTAARKKTVEIRGDDFTGGNGIGLLDLSVGTSTRTTTTLTTFDSTIGNNTSLNDLTTAATRATRTIAGAQAGATNDLTELTSGGGANTVTANVVGNLGTVAITFNVAAVQADIGVLRDAINAVASQTGVIATGSGAAATNDLTLTSSFVGATGAATLTATAATAGADVATFNAAVGALTAGVNGVGGATTFRITGNKGTADILLTDNNLVINNGASVLRDLINTRTGTTGVSAAVNAAGNIVLTSSGVGSSSLASIEAISPSAAGDITTLSSQSTKTSVTGVDGVSNSTTIELQGDLGRSVITFNNDAVINNSSALSNAINAVTSLTGITASGSGHGGTVTLTSRKYGSAAVASASAIAATNSADVTLFNSVGAAGTQRSLTGVDAQGSITHARGTGTISAIGEALSYQDSSINFTGVTNPALNAATFATKTIRGDSAGAFASAGLDSLSSTTGNTISFTVTGNLGSAAISGVNVNALKADSRLLVDQINAQSLTTGVRASTTANGSGTFALTDIVLTAITPGAAGNVNIVASSATAGGDVTVFNAGNTSTANTAGTSPTATASFDVTGGALFQIGPTVNFSNQVTVNITSLDLSTLGRNFSTTGIKALSALKTGGTDVLSSADLSTAEQLIGQAISQVATLRGQLGALQKNVLESNIASQQTSLEQVTAAQSSIRDADFAAETAALTKNQILVQAGTSVLSIANSSPQQILALLPRG